MRATNLKGITMLVRGNRELIGRYRRNAAMAEFTPWK
jgi:hypothetical protein